jgi:hypothetical protein
MYEPRDALKEVSLGMTELYVAKTQLNQMIRRAVPKLHKGHIHKRPGKAQVARGASNRRML